MLQKTSAYGEQDIHSHIYSNLADENNSDLPKLKKVSLSKSVPASNLSTDDWIANDQAKFDDPICRGCRKAGGVFSFGMSSDLIDKQGLIYEGAEGRLTFLKLTLPLSFGPSQRFLKTLVT